MTRSVTVRDVAKSASVSIATVSRVLNNQGNTNEEIRARVLKVASELGYTQPLLHKNLSSLQEQSIKDIAFVLDYNGVEEPKLDTFWTNILHGAESEALKSNIRVTYQGIRRNQTERMLHYLQHELHAGGILLVGPSGKETVQVLQEANLPLVLVDNYLHLPYQQVDVILSANLEGTKEAVSYLINEGHRSIAFLGAHFGAQEPWQSIYSFEKRKTGYLEALCEARLPWSEQLIADGNFAHFEDIAQTCKQLVERNPEMTALMCANDIVAILAVKALYELGRRVPEDISVIGFDDVEVTEHLTPALTTVHVHKEAMGANAIRALLARAANPDAIGVTHVVHTDLVKRASVCPPRS